MRILDVHDIRSTIAIAAIAFRRAWHARTLVVVAAGLLLFLIVELSQLGDLRAAESAGEWERVAAIRLSGAATILDLWFGAALLVGLILGTTAVSFEARSGALESILAKPIERRTFLLGEWLGVESFLLLFLAAGAGGSLLILGLPRLDPGPLFWWGGAQILARTFLMTSLFVSLGAVLRPVTAGVTALVLHVLPDLVRPWLDHEVVPLRALALVGHSLAPAAISGDAISAGLTRSSLAPIGWLPGLVVLENMGYGLAVLVVCGAIFARRDVPSSS